MKMERIIAGMELRDGHEVRDRIYNISSAKKLIDEHLSENVELHLFETESCGRGLYYATTPLFAVSNPEAITRKWAAILQRINEVQS